MSSTTSETPSLPEGLRVPLNPIEGPTPAQRLLAATPVKETPTRPTEELLFRLFGIIEQVLRPDVSGRYGALLQDIAEDQTYGDVTYLGLLRAPVQTLYCFSGEGGLLKHILCQWDLWVGMKEGRPGPDDLSFDDATLADVDVNDGQILEAIIGKALSRAWVRFVEVHPATVNSPWQVVTGQHETDQLLCSGGKAVLLLQHREIILDGGQLHVLLRKPGGYCSALARVVERLDYLSRCYRHMEELEA